MNKAKFIAFLLLCIFGLQCKSPSKAQSVVGNWKVITIAGNPIQEPYIVLLAFTEDGNFTMMTPEGELTATFIYLPEQKLIDISWEGRKEAWKIISMSDSSMVLNDGNNGELALERSNLTAVPKMEIKENLAEKNEPQLELKLPDENIYSIKTDYKPQKNDKDRLVGEWKVVRMGRDVINKDEGKLYIHINNKSEFHMVLNGNIAQSAKWKIVDNGQALELTSDIIEKWGIKHIDSKKLILIDPNIGDMELLKQ